MSFGPNSSSVVHAATCPACGHPVAIQLFTTETEPGRSRPSHRPTRRPLEVVRCVDCGHAFNAGCEPTSVGPADRPCRTFTGAPGWAEHVHAVRDEILGRVPPTPVVVEIGHGDAEFLTGLAEARPTGRYIGFDPRGVTESRHEALELRTDRFSATRTLAALTPHLIVSRYVIDYLANPLGFVQELAFAAAWAGIQPVLYLEVPCVDRALETGRTFGFDHEHTSYFTTASFMRMLSRCGLVEQRIGHAYQREVLYAFVRLGRGHSQLEHARAVETFRGRAREALARLRRQLDGLAASGRTVAIWGGTGEAAAFIAQVGADAHRFPVVIDPDPDAIGTYVPDTGQQIRSPEWLRDNPVDVVIVAVQRSARDVMREITASGVRCDTIMIESGGRLVDHVAESRPLRRQSLAALAS
jgi:hypothetical protein